jgi:hypothetical protein
MEGGLDKSNYYESQRDASKKGKKDVGGLFYCRNCEAAIGFLQTMDEDLVDRLLGDDWVPMDEDELDSTESIEESTEEKEANESFGERKINEIRKGANCRYPWGDNYLNVFTKAAPELKRSVADLSDLLAYAKEKQ